ncbi:MAG: hypothetical protein CBE24_07510 [bacterium TMED264]|nr:MAG: hypothetical protein CBE24_07510 [bacterium TMED264]
MRKYLILLLLFASVIGITLMYTFDILPSKITELYMTEDSKPTASMLVDSVIEAEVKKEVIPEPLIEEVLETEVPESIPKAIGEISEISQPLDKYYLIAASFLDNDLAFDYAEKLILSGSNVILILDFHVRYFTRVALLEYETLDKANVGLDKYKDEFDEQLWVLKY